MVTEAQDRGRSTASPEYFEVRDGDASLPVAVYRPSGTPRAALVVAPGGLAKGDLETSRWAGERLAAAGHLALVSTYREASPYDDVRDLRLGLDWLEHESGVPGDRLIAFGHSRGGLAALRLAAADRRVRSVVAIAPPTDIAAWVNGLAGFAPTARDAGVQFMGGTPEEIPAQYDQVCALGLAKDIAQPVLLIHGSGDMRVPVEHSAWLEQALRDAGKSDVQLHVMPGVGHFLELATLGYQFDAVMALVTQWLDAQLAR